MLALVSRLLRLAAPVALARFGIMGMALADVMVVGQFKPAELPHQALANAPIGVLLVTGIGLLTGVQVLGARALGAQAPHEAGATFRRGLVLATLAGAFSVGLVWLLGPRLFTVFGIEDSLAVPSARVARILALSLPLHFQYVATAFFLEAAERPLASVVVMWGANVVNLGLNLLLVGDYGALGSAWATVGARLCLALVLLVWLFCSADASRFGVLGGARGPTYRQLLRVGGAAAVSHAAEAGAFSGMTVIAGRLGASEVAAYQILLNLLAVVFMGALGISTAAAVLTSEAIGRRDAPAAGRASFAGVLVSLTFAVIAALPILALAPLISRAYTADLALAARVAGLMWLVALTLAPDGGQAVVAATLRGRGDNWFPAASHLLSYAVVMPAIAFVLAERQGYGVTGLMLAILSASIVSFSVLGWRLWSLRHSLPSEGPRVVTVVGDSPGPL